MIYTLFTEVHTNIANYSIKYTDIFIETGINKCVEIFSKFQYRKHCDTESMSKFHSKIYHLNFKQSLLEINT